MSYDPMVAMDDEGNEVRDHALLSRSTDGDTVFHAPVRLRRLTIDGGQIEALEEHWHDDGLRGHTLVFLAADVALMDDPTLMRTAAEVLGVDLDAPKGAAAAGAVSVNRRPSPFVYVTGAFYAEYVDD